MKPCEKSFDRFRNLLIILSRLCYTCLLYTSDAADDTPCVDLGGRRIIKKSFFQAEDGIRDFCLSRGLGDVYKRQLFDSWFSSPIFKMHRHLFKCDQFEKMI